MLLSKSFASNQWASFLALVFLGLFFSDSFFQDTLLNSMSQILIDADKLTPLEMSTLSSLFFVSASICFLLGGIILDHMAIKPLVIFSSLCSVSAVLILLLTRSYYFLLISRMLFGLGYSFSFLCCMRFVAKFYSRHFSLIMGIISAFLVLFGMLSQAPFIYLFDQFGLQKALLVNVIFSLFIFSGLVFMRKEYGGFEKKESHVFRGLKVFFETRDLFFKSCYASFINAPILFLGSLWGNIYLVQSYHVSRESAGYYLSFIFLGLMLGCPLFGWLGARARSRKIIMTLGPALMFLLSMILVFKIGSSQGSLSMIMGLLGFFSSLQTLIYPEILDATSSKHFASAVGMTTFSVMMLSALMQSMFGFMLHFHLNGVLLLPLVLLLGLFISLLSK